MFANNVGGTLAPGAEDPVLAIPETLGESLANDCAQIYDFVALPSGDPAAFLEAGRDPFWDLAPYEPDAFLLQAGLRMCNELLRYQNGEQLYWEWSFGPSLASTYSVHAFMEAVDTKNIAVVAMVADTLCQRNSDVAEEFLSWID